MMLRNTCHMCTHDDDARCTRLTYVAIMGPTLPRAPPSAAAVIEVRVPDAGGFGEVSQALRHSTVRLARQQLYPISYIGRWCSVSKKTTAGVASYVEGQGEQLRQCPRAMAVVLFAFAVLCHETPEPVSTAAFELSLNAKEKDDKAQSHGAFAVLRSPMCLLRCSLDNVVCVYTM